MTSLQTKDGYGRTTESAQLSVKLGNTTRLLNQHLYSSEK